MKKGKLLIIDDNEDILFALNLLLEPYMEQIRVATQPERIDHFMRTFIPDIILLDMNFKRDAISGQEGFYWLEKIKKIDPDVVVLFMTAYSDTDKAVRAIKAGATDFIPKPWEKEKLLATLSSALELRESRAEVRNLKKQVEILSSPEDAGFEIIGESEPMQAIFATVDKLKNTDANILILGENGTGKDLVARALYHQSPRSGNLFVGIDVGSIPEQLFESELFGYEKGAFTDARKEKPGRMEVASGGTLFLDEIGNLTYEVQVQLLRALQERKVKPIGSNQEIAINVRLISATNENLRQAIEKGDFREDLYHRINEFTIRIPDLKERKEDLLLFANHFLDLANSELQKDIIGFDNDTMQLFQSYSWPGNLRQMKNVIKYATLLATGRYITRKELPEELTENLSSHTNIQLKNVEHERDLIRKALQECGNNKTRAAQLLGIDRKTLYNKLKIYQLD